jgi:hypothetical protein
LILNQGNVYNRNGGEILSKKFITNFIKVRKENGKEIKKFKRKIEQHCLDEPELLKILNEIYEADIAKEVKKKLWACILLLPEKEINLPSGVINQIKNDIGILRGEEKRAMEHFIWETEQINNKVDEKSKSL